MMNVRAGGRVGPGGEQVPERGAPAVHLRQERGRVGQAGALGHRLRRALQQRALAHPDPAPLVSYTRPLPQFNLLFYSHSHLLPILPSASFGLPRTLYQIV